jgi:hypothetical protein
MLDHTEESKASCTELLECRDVREEGEMAVAPEPWESNDATLVLPRFGDGASNAFFVPVNGRSKNLLLSVTTILTAEPRVLAD